MEPLNLMVSLSHFANAKREHKHGLGERAGRGRKREHRASKHVHGWWRLRLRRVAVSESSCD
jgi:hypothetical protein